jgi:ribosomal protein S18 acetylase RimI-like enzyme
MTIRRATEADEAVLRALWEEFVAEVPELPHRGELDAEKELSEIRELVRSSLGLVAEDAEGAAGYALAKLDGPCCHLVDLYVRPRARRAGTAKALMGEVAAWGMENGAHTMTLEVLTSNVAARVVYDRLDFEEESRLLYAPLPQLSKRLAADQHAPSRGSIHLQTDDVDAVVRAVQQFVPRLPGGSRGSVVMPPVNGWIAVYDELCDREPAMLRRLALELSDRMGAVICAIGIEQGAVVRYVLLERGRVMDEYASVPEYQGPLPPGDVVALSANPTVLARLTGADPAAVRETAKTAERPSELPPPAELLAALAAIIGIPLARSSYEQAREFPGAVVLDRASGV